MLMEEGTPASTTPEPPNEVSFFHVNHDKLVKLPAGAKGLPSWAPPDARNLRGMCEINSCHYAGLMSINGGFVEVLLDSGGSRTMIDK